MWKWITPLVFLSASAIAQQESGTAYDALRTISGQLGKPALNHVISISGAEGDPQPKSWTVMLEDSQSPTSTREVVVSNGRIVSDRPPDRAVIGSARNSTIKTSKLNLDSSGAFQVATRVADRSAARFDKASYTLRADERGEPVWIITLHGVSGKPIGTIHINSTRGNVVRTEGLFAGATMEDVQEDPAYVREERSEQTTVRTERRSNNDDQDEDNDDDDHGPLYGVRSRLRGSFQHAQEEARGMFDRVKQSFDDTIHR
jgi:hypothetical protein